MIYLFLAGLVTTAALFTLLANNILHRLLGLLSVLLGTAALFFAQGASLLAAAQVLVYGSGVLVLFLVSTFMLPIAPSPQHTSHILPAGLLTLITWSLAPMAWMTARIVAPATVSNEMQEHAVEHVGVLLIGHYALAFEWIGFILLIALVGAVALITPLYSFLSSVDRKK